MCVINAHPKHAIETLCNRHIAIAKPLNSLQSLQLQNFGDPRSEMEMRSEIGDRRSKIGDRRSEIRDRICADPAWRVGKIAKTQKNAKKLEIRGCFPGTISYDADYATLVVRTTTMIMI